MDVPHYLPQLLRVDVSSKLKAHLSLTTWLYDIGKHYQCKLRCPSDYSLHSYTHTCTTGVGLSGLSSPAHCRPGRCVGAACRGSQDHLVNLWPSQESNGKLHCQGVIRESSQTLVHSSALVLAAPQAALSRARAAGCAGVYPAAVRGRSTPAVYVQKIQKGASPAGARALQASCGNAL